MIIATERPVAGGQLPGMLIDTHCHLDAEHFPEGPVAVLDRARAAGVAHLVVVGVGATTDTARFVTQLSADHHDVSATVGMHPHEASSFDDEMADDLEALSHRPGVVAIGEAGLDYHYLRSPVEQQQQVFRRMIALARQRRLPLVVHTRSAPEETLAILEEEDARDVGGIIHCFSEDRAFAKRALDLDFDISFSGIVTFGSAAAVKDVARWLPADRLMVETDSPYLAPAPLRGKRNEPAYVVHTARFLAELRGEPFDDLVAQSGRTAVRRLGLVPGGATA